LRAAREFIKQLACPGLPCLDFGKCPGEVPALGHI
jgi:hypothetical protein